MSMQINNNIYNNNNNSSLENLPNDQTPPLPSLPPEIWAMVFKNLVKQKNGESADTFLSIFKNNNIHTGALLAKETLTTNCIEETKKKKVVFDKISNIFPSKFLHWHSFSSHMNCQLVVSKDAVFRNIYVKNISLNGVLVDPFSTRTWNALIVFVRTFDKNEIHNTPFKFLNLIFSSMTFFPYCRYRQFNLDFERIRTDALLTPEEFQTLLEMAAISGHMHTEGVAKDQLYKIAMIAAGHGMYQPLPNFTGNDAYNLELTNLRNLPNDVKLTSGPNELFQLREIKFPFREELNMTPEQEDHIMEVILRRGIQFSKTNLKNAKFRSFTGASLYKNLSYMFAAKAVELDEKTDLERAKPFYIKLYDLNPKARLECAKITARFNPRYIAEFIDLYELSDNEKYLLAQGIFTHTDLDIKYIKNFELTASQNLTIIEQQFNNNKLKDFNWLCFSLQGRRFPGKVNNFKLDVSKDMEKELIKNQRYTKLLLRSLESLDLGFFDRNDLLELLGDLSEEILKIANINERMLYLFLKLPLTDKFLAEELDAVIPTLGKYKFLFALRLAIRKFDPIHPVPRKFEISDHINMFNFTTENKFLIAKIDMMKSGASFFSFMYKYNLPMNLENKLKFLYIQKFGGNKAVKADSENLTCAQTIEDREVIGPVTENNAKQYMVVQPHNNIERDPRKFINFLVQHIAKSHNEKVLVVQNVNPEQFKDKERARTSDEAGLPQDSAKRLRKDDYVSKI